MNDDAMWILQEQGDAACVGWKGGGCFWEVVIERLTISLRNPSKGTGQVEH